MVMPYQDDVKKQKKAHLTRPWSLWYWIISLQVREVGLKSGEKSRIAIGMWTRHKGNLENSSPPGQMVVGSQRYSISLGSQGHVSLSGSTAIWGYTKKVQTFQGESIGGSHCDGPGQCDLPVETRRSLWIQNGQNKKPELPAILDQRFVQVALKMAQISISQCQVIEMMLGCSLWSSAFLGHCS